MSTTPPETTSPAVTDPIPLGAFGRGASAETAPSAMLADAYTTPRIIGFAGLVLFVLGAAAVISTKALGPRMVSEGLGLLFAVVGLAFMLYHAVTDGEQEIRRMYGSFAAFWIVVSLVASFLPGPMGDATAEKAVAFYLLPWGVSTALIGLLFTVPFCRHETDDLYRNAALTALLAIGGLLSVGSVAAGVFRPDFLTGPGLTLALLGLAFLCAYLGQVDTSEGTGYTVAFALGAFGAAVACYAVGRAAFPTLLYEGPTTFRLANGTLDAWTVLFRVLAGLAFLVPVAIALATRAPLWLKGATAAVAVIGGGVVVASMFVNPVHTPPSAFLVPNGMILMTVGLLYLVVSLGMCSDNQFVTLTRRELSSYFLSPVGYFVLGGMAFVEWNQYRVFYSALARAEGPMPEPIVQILLLAFLPVFALLLQVPVLTMRLVAEERRTGSLEVLLTAPVDETPVVLSKFLATWLFFLISWLPLGLFLISLRLETGVPFDYRPLLSFYLCLATQGLAFIGMGLFFSTVTRNQIIAAVLTFVGMIAFWQCFQLRQGQLDLGLPAAVQAALGRLSFIHMWFEALSGRLPLRDAMLFASVGAFWTFLSVKVLEARKWS
ncbi:ABC transporter permease [Gemmata sp.]|uniref:ABC transporter permease n=1 Tax=Gemmata sp. TaxID=1914242 RepID=UPI003F7274E8